VKTWHKFLMFARSQSRLSTLQQKISIIKIVDLAAEDLHHQNSYTGKNLMDEVLTLSKNPANLKLVGDDLLNNANDLVGLCWGGGNSRAI
jgi:chromosome condensin MukBEF MukE localization factor